MKGKKKTRGMRGHGGTSAHDHTPMSHAQETTGSDKKMGSSYGQAKGPAQQLAGAEKKGHGRGKIRREAGSKYMGSSGG